MSLFKSLRPITSRANLQPARSTTLTRRRCLATSTDTSTLPLAGFKVLDMTRVLAGVRRFFPLQDCSYALTSTSLIAHRYLEILGTDNQTPQGKKQDEAKATEAIGLTGGSAEVIKIEHPTRGDDTRAWGPPYATYTQESGKQGSGESAYFLAVRKIGTI